MDALEAGVAAVRARQWDEAVSRLEAAHLAAPEDFWAVYWLGYSLARLGRRDEAIRRLASVEGRREATHIVAVAQIEADLLAQDPASALRRFLALSANPRGAAEGELRRLAWWVARASLETQTLPDPFDLPPAVRKWCLLGVFQRAQAAPV